MSSTGGLGLGLGSGLGLGLGLCGATSIEDVDVFDRWVALYERHAHVHTCMHAYVQVGRPL